MKRFFIRYVLPRIFMVVSSIVIVITATEITMQVYFRLWGSQEQRIMYIYSSKKIESLNLAYLSVPFVGYVPSPALEEHNSLGYRGHEITIPKPEGVFRIVATGGSTTYGDGLSDAESWPRQLEHLLREDYGYSNVEVINAAALRYNTWNTVSNFEFRVLEFEPDLVIVYDSVNDLLVRLRPPECYAGLSPTRGLSEGQWREDFHLSHSSLYRYLGIRLGWVQNPLILPNWLIPIDNFYPCEAAPVSDEIALATNPPTYFERNLVTLAGIAQAHDVQVVFSSWAFYAGDQSPISAAWQTALYEQNEAIQRAAEKTDSMYYDLMGNLPVDFAYWQSDGIHQNAASCALQAGQYVDFLIANELLPKPENQDIR